MSARILVVDDVLTNVKLLEAKLTAEYYEVITAQDGPTALEMAASEAPDLILLDIMMPAMDGFEVCRRLKAMPSTRHIPVVMVTALSDVSDRVRGLEAGADDFLSKPVNDIALFARVRSLVRLKLMMDELRLRQAAAGDDAMLERNALEEPVEDARILVVDGPGVTAESIENYLRTGGHEVSRECSSTEGMKRALKSRYDLAIVSLDIQGEDGLRLCSHLRSQEQTRHLPILLILHDNELPQLAKGLELGVTDYLIKPIDRNELLARTRTQVRRRRYHDRLHDLFTRSVSLAYTDTLTGLYNRRYLNANLDRKLLEIAESAKPVSLIMLDVDHFKPVNDHHGHGVGDEVLKEIAHRLTDGVRDIDFVARFGGEEFAVVMPDSTSEIAGRVAERLRRLVADSPVKLTNGSSLDITVSLGVATAESPMEEAEDLLRRADAALYEAKGAGRNRVCIDRGQGASQYQQTAQAS